MKKNVIIILSAVIVIAGGLGLVVVNSNSQSSEDSLHPTSSANEQEPRDASPANELDPNNYTDGAEIGERSGATDKKEVSIEVEDFIFKTTYLKIKKGTKVTWTNQGQARHDVNSADDSPHGGLASELLDNGDSYSYTFDEAGLYEYFCTPHPSQMRATVTVVE